MAFEQRLRADALKILYNYWQELRRGRRAPTRADIDPAKIAQVLPSILMLDVEESPRRFKIRLMGTRIVSWYGADPTNLYLDEIDLGGKPMSTYSILDGLVDRMAPAHMTGEYTKHDGRTIRYERLFMPLSSDGQRVDKIIGAAFRLPLDAEIVGDALDL